MNLSNFTNLDTKSWDDLIKLRQQNANNPDLQTVLAPYEHQAYYREMAQSHPLEALMMGIIEPVYQGAKGIGILPSTNMTTPASMDQITRSWRGIGQGIKSHF